MPDPLILKHHGGARYKSQRAMIVRGPITGAMGTRVEIDTTPYPMFLDKDELLRLIRDLMKRLEAM